jgi:type I restriction enzyme R subunit
MFVSSKREIAYNFWKEVIALRPAWNQVLVAEEGAELSEQGG